MPPDSKVLTVAETAELVRTTPGAIYAQRYRGEEPGVLGFTSGRKVMFLRSDVEGWLAAQRAKARADLAARRTRRRPDRSRGVA